MKRGDVVEFNESMPRFTGVKVKIVRVSRRTGGLTVELLTSPENAPAYPVGTVLNVAAYNLRPALVAR